MLTRHTSKAPVKFPHALGQRKNFPNQSPEKCTHVQQAGRTASERFNWQIAQSSRQSPRPTLSCAAQSVELPRRARIGSGLVLPFVPSIGTNAVRADDADRN